VKSTSQGGSKRKIPSSVRIRSSGGHCLHCVVNGIGIVLLQVMLDPKTPSGRSIISCIYIQWMRVVAVCFIVQVFTYLRTSNIEMLDVEDDFTFKR
jgi:hypothetical protein